MGQLKEIRLEATTDVSGDATVNATKGVFGRLCAVQFDDTDLDAGADLTISVQSHAASKTLLTLTNQAASGLFYPRDLVHDESGSALTGTSGGDRTMPLMVGVPRLVVAQGGNTKTGAVILFYFEG